MSTFGDGTPHEDLFNAAETIQDDYALTDEELVIILLAVLREKNDASDEKNDELRKKERK